jgi:hypothetical protein
VGPTSRFSRYYLCTGQLDANGFLFLSEPVPFRYVDRPDNIEHTANAGDTWWGLAAQFYPDIPDAANLCWGYIADFQPVPVVDPTLAIVPGTTIYIPSYQTLLQEIVSESRRPSFSA